MEFSQLEAFLEAANRGSFRRAADALYLSQPSVSARVQTLESEVGVALFHRTARGVRLTDMGRIFLPFAQRSIETLRRGREVLESVRQTSAGILNMATARVIGTYVLPETLQKFQQLYPDANLHIKVGGSSDVLQMVVDEEVQLGLARFMQHPDVDALHLYDEEAVLVVHPGHSFTKTRVAAMSQVAQEPLIVYDPGDPGSSYFQFINRVCRDAGVTAKVEMNLDSVEAAKNMVRLGLGVSFLPRSAVRREVEFESLILIDLAEVPPVLLPTYLLLRRGQEIGPTARSFLKLLQETYNVEIPVLLEDR
ncbi:MAG: LysR family transcriptional regulator [SAR202 cluster bacterium]|uniref:Transcriptional regulator, LysR family n=1 Tax=hydrothermal vent metagenome TaxID=652676 RepID=A0A160V8R3_9ZZZZ|nr:LysR family transcriptional regulator [Dehalococcoidia bacterium]MQF92281.1 LysR family transcriptional regulator [SAR202 cluster bacterium]MCH2500713.1 LysR family transcriptional regulator [Dehalococcoidia bacterium]MQG13342.1 LysR family transcriptional regulator [SAR202 cluster bacterium]MQG62666.1 LysR family transcriptional regulator [SAR202 cluster bacterium]|tara:strand:- start:275 stop:1198 length:924 start_codon:yes stop_codon:yes gene_type:complete